MHRAPIKSYRMLFGFFIVGLMVFIFYLWHKQLLHIAPPARADHWVVTSPGTYQYRQKITLNSSQIIGTLTNFPVLISFTDANLISPSNGGTYVTNANGYDIVFASIGGHPTPSPALLPFERTSYNLTTGAITAWVLVPSLSATTNEIYVYYGNTSITTSQSNPSAVWGPTGANYTGVWHLDETSTCPVPAPGFLDSTDPTATGRHGTCVNSPAFYPNGQINGARDFAGTVSQGQGINIPSLTLNTSFTYEAWVRPTSFTSPDVRIFIVNNAYTRWLGTETIDLLWYPPANTFWDDIMGGGGNIFHYIAFTADSANTRFYHNNLSSGISPPLAFSQITDTFSIGYARGYPSLNEYFAGQIDEVRISNGARSANWLQTSYNNQLNQGVGVGKFILTLGDRQTGSRPLPPTLDELPSYPNRYTPSTMPRLGTFSTTDAEGNSLEYEIQWDDDVGFGSPVAPVGGTQNSSNFATNGFSAATFPSGALGIFYDIGQTEPLADGVTYWWRVRAKDTGVGASGLWSDYSVPRSITINTALPEEGWFQTTDAQFSTDTLTNAVTTGTGGVKIFGF